jgi:hypothetical protein
MCLCVYGPIRVHVCVQQTLDATHRELAEARGSWKKSREEVEEAARQADLRRCVCVCVCVCVGHEVVCT